MWTTLYIRLLGLLVILVALPQPALGQRESKARAQNAFTPGEVWLDTKGKPINAHGGGMLYYDQTYYWYGENKVGRSWIPEANRKWDGYRVEVTGIRCYSSKDLYRWKDQGLVLKAVPADPSSDLHPSKVIERPKVAFNPRTRKFVMRMHWHKSDLPDSRYVWLPILLGGEEPKLKWLSKWDLSFFDWNQQGAGKDLPSTGAGPGFSIQMTNGYAWLVRPDGQRFFSFGVCVVDQGAAKSNFNPTNPGYAAFQHYADSNDWATATVKRLKSWNFTTVGGWSDYQALQRCCDEDVAFTPVLHVGSTAGAPWLDMWDTNRIARMHQVAREQVIPVRNDPRLLGYYSDNEMGWWNAALWKLTLEHPPTSRQRQRLLALLRQTYHNQWPELLKDFESENAASFENLEQRGMLYLRPGGEGIRVYRRFLGLVAERYYALVKEVLRTYDARGLILGDRYQSFYYPEVVRACARDVDAASSNLNAAWNDGTFPRFYLHTLRALSGKPVIVSEFYMAAQENRSGNKNDTSSFPTVMTQKQRVAGFRTSVQALARTPYVIGADWFQYYDEPRHGRGDGENYNFGLVDIFNAPYERLVAAASDLDLPALHAQPSALRRDALEGIPPAPRNPLGQFTIRRALEHWDRERGFVKPVSDAPVADLYLCWDSKAVYLGLYAQDIVEADYYRNKIVPEVDRAEWVVVIGPGGPSIRARLGPFGQAVVSEPSVRLVNLAGIYMNTRNVAAMELPARLFGKARLASGESIEVASAFFTHARADRVEWRGTFTLKSRR